MQPYSSLFRILFSGGILTVQIGIVIGLEVFLSVCLQSVLIHIGINIVAIYLLESHCVRYLICMLKVELVPLKGTLTKGRQTLLYKPSLTSVLYLYGFP